MLEARHITFDVVMTLHRLGYLTIFHSDPAIENTSPLFSLPSSIVRSVCLSFYPPRPPLPSFTSLCLHQTIAATVFPPIPAINIHKQLATFD